MLPGLYNYPVIGFLRIQGPFNAAKPEDSSSIRKVIPCRPASSDEERACAREILMKLAKLAYRRPISEDDMAPLMDFFELGLGQGTFEEA